MVVFCVSYLEDEFNSPSCIGSSNDRLEVEGLELESNLIYVNNFLNFLPLDVVENNIWPWIVGRGIETY